MTTTSSRTSSGRPIGPETILFIDVDEFEDAIADAAGDSDQEFIDNLKPISGLGVTAWVDDDVSHSVFRLATN